mmetsp:Transcript_36225/g.53138  ORF Transcript_36225/g.53138 Transcript_36225/m.53138 type:complete len:148 (+) Transcript_36225:172-615(+)|eukprot:CAMPEP_0173129094 /NCGR_PEP_ID=MMETSP1102-20130122/58951_1 /TAXON_ID=49646 /ORGANISM="Geminigera sp., Strain Caron Lab Isolate" /LENGTH=147 /DNA_ID=CAMNT_0014039375 /DNA_START=167 /DNA_END=610 /DNA_ORIENTATION=-
MSEFARRPNVICNRHAPACFWAEAQVPYVSPGQGGGETEKYVDLKAKKGDRVKISQAFVGHYPTLCKVEGTLTSRAGRGWAVFFDGFQQEMLFNVEPEMRQLTHVSPLPSGGREGGGGGLEDVQGLVGVHAVEGVPEGSAVEGGVSQ